MSCPSGGWSCSRAQHNTMFHTSGFWKAEQSTGWSRHTETFDTLTRCGTVPDFTRQVVKLIKMIWLFPPRTTFSRAWSITQHNREILLPSRLHWNPKWGFRLLSGELSSPWGGGRRFGRIPLKVCGNHLLRLKGGRDHSLKTDLPCLWSWGLRAQRHTTAADPECFCFEHPLFQKCSQRGKSIPGVPITGTTDHTPQWKAARKSEQWQSLMLAPLPSPRCSPTLRPSPQYFLQPEAMGPCCPFLHPTREPQPAATIGRKQEGERVEVTGLCWLAAQEEPGLR